MATQELKTQLVFDAFNAIQNVEALHNTLKKIARVDFKKLSSAFKDLSKNFKLTQQSAEQTVQKIAASSAQSIGKKAIPDIRNYKKQLATLQKEFDNYASFFQIPYINVKQEQRLREMARLNSELARLYQNAGQAEKGLKHLQEAISQASIVEKHSGSNPLKKQYEQQYEELYRYVLGRKQEITALNEKIPGTKEWDAVRKNRLRQLEEETKAENTRLKLETKKLELAEKQRVQAEKILQDAYAKQLALEGRMKDKKPLSFEQLGRIEGQFRNWSIELNRLAPDTTAPQTFDAFLTKIKEVNAALVEEKANAQKLKEELEQTARAERLLWQANAEKEKISVRMAEGKKPYTQTQWQNIEEKFRRWGAELDKIAPAQNASKGFAEFLRQTRESNDALSKTIEREKVLNEEIKIRLALSKALEKTQKAEEAAAQKAAAAALKAEKEKAEALRRQENELRQLERLNQRLVEQEYRTRDRLKSGKPFNDTELLELEHRIKNIAADIDRIAKSNMSGALEPFMRLVRNQNYDLVGKIEEKQNASLTRKEEEEKIRRYERLARLAGRIAEIQAKINGKFSIGKPFTEAEFVKLRNQLHNIGLEMDRITGKNVSGYMSYILDNAKVKNTPSTNATAQRLSDQYNDVRKKVEEAATQFARTKSIADAIRFNAAMRDLKELTKETETVNRLLGRTQGFFERITNLLSRRMRWHFGDEIIRSAMSFPSELFQNYRDLEQAMAGVQQVIPLIEGQPKQVFAETESLIEIANDFARTAQEVVEGAQLWGRGYGKPSNDADEIRQSLEETNQMLEEQGLSVDAVTDKTVNYINQAEAMATTNELVRQSAMLATVDNFSMAESVKGLEAVLAAYGLRAKTAAEATLFAGRAVDIISKVAHYGQISAQDLVRGIEATGKAAEQAGISLEFLSAMIETGVRNTAKSGSDIGNAIKALTVGIYGDKGQEELSKFGIETTYVDDDGIKKARSAQSIILDIARALQEGNINARQMVLAISGGRYQYSKLYAILKDEEEILRMWSEAVESAGFADKQLEVQMNTVNSKIKQLEANVQSLYQTAMSGAIGDLIKSGIEKISAAVKGLEKNLHAAQMGLTAFLAMFAAGKMISLVTAFVALTKNLKAFHGELKAAGQAGGIFGVLKSGIKGIPEEFKNRARQRATFVTQALTASEKQLTVEQQKQIAIQSAMLAQAFEIAGARAKEAGATDVATAALRANTLANQANALAAGELAALTRGKTLAVEADTVAARVNTAALGGQAAAGIAASAATTVATMGLNLVIGALLVGVPLLISWADSTETAAERLDKLSDATEKNIEKAKTKQQRLSQEIMQRKQQVEIMDQAIKYYIADTKAMEKYEKGSKEWEKAAKGAKNAEEALIKALGGGEIGKEAVERIKAASDMQEAFEKEKDAFKKTTNEKEKLLEGWKNSERAYYDERLKQARKQLDMYQADISAFGNWTDAHLQGLSILQTGYLKFWEAVHNASKEVSNFFSIKGLDPKANRLQRFFGSVADYAKEQATGEGWFGWGPKNKTEEYQKVFEDLEASKAASESTQIDFEPYDPNIDKGKVTEEEESKSSKKKKPKYVEQYDTVMMRYLGAVAKQSKKLSVADLVAMGGYIKGGSGLLYNPLDMSDVNPFGVTQALMQQFNPDGSITNIEDNARAFNEAVIAFNGSAEEFLEWWFLQIGRAKDAADAALLRAQTVNQAEYLENGNDAFGGIDYKKRANTFAIHKSMSDALKSHVVTAYDGNSIAGLYSWAKEESGYLMPDEVFDYIVEIAKQRNYAPDMLKNALAVAIQESNGVQASVSDAGARGIFQLMPETAADLGVDPYDWRQNIQGGMTYLEQQAREFDGDLRKTLAAYNAGADSVYYYGGVPPIAETQNYVKEIEERLSHIADYEKKPHPSSVDDNGEGTYWVRQHGGVSLEGAQPETVAAIRAMGQWFQQRTGRPLVISSVTDGTSHVHGKISHYSGHKFDAHDGGSGAEGSLFTDDFNRGYLLDEFIKYAHWLGLGVNIENEGKPSVHADFDVTGREWIGPWAGQSFGGFNKARAGLAKTSKEQNLPYVLEEGGLNSYWSAQNKQFKEPYLSFDKLPQLQKEWSEKQHAYETQLTAMQTRQKNADNLLALYKSVYEKKTGQSYDTAREEQNQLLRLQNEYLLEQNFVEQIKEKQDFISEWRQNVKDYVYDFLQSHKQIATLLSQKGVAWDDLTGDQQLSIAKRFGGDDNEELEEMIKNSEQLRQEWHSVNQLLDTHKQRLIDIRYQMANIGNIPVISPEDAENAILKHFELDYKNDTTGAIYENPDRLRQYKLKRIDLLQRRKVRLEGEKRIADDDADRRKQALLERLESEKDVQKALQQRQDAGEDVNIELQTQEMLIKRLNADYQTLNLHGTQEQINYQLRIKETTNEIKELEKSLYPIENQLWQSLSDGVMNMFDSILIKGNSFKDAWNNLWQSIASMALRQLLMVQLQAWSMKFGWGLFGDGGEIPKKKNGGYIPSFASGGVLKKYSAGSKIDAGIIKGAGTGTSDSILAYLENRGQFIRTSDGEFIIKKKSVDTLGLSFLNRLNENPEQIAFKEKVLNAYAGGGSLGEEMAPVMSDKTVENLQLFTKNQTEKENRNVRQEKLLEGISAQLSTFTQPVNETTNMNINAVDSRSFVQLLEKHSDVLMGLMRRERGRRNSY